MEVIPGVHAVPGVVWSRVYLIEGDTLALVDSGMPWNVRTVLKYIKSIGRRPEELSSILVTHSHPDHTAGALGLSRETGAKVLAHPQDTKAHSNSDVSLSYMGVFTSLRLPLPFLQRTGVHHLVSDDELLPILGGVRVLHTPGHTAGSVCYLLESQGVLFSGDTVFSDGTRLSRSVPFPGYDARLYRSSLERLAGLEFESVCGGHGRPLVGGAAEKLRRLLAERPEPPSWRQWFKSIPRRLYKARGLHGEEYLH